MQSILCYQYFVREMIQVLEETRIFFYSALYIVPLAG